MTTSTEHYTRAENLIDLAHRPSVWPWRRKALRERALVHSTLALAAATALGRYNDLLEADRVAWYRAASEGPTARQRRQEAEAAEAAEYAWAGSRTGQTAAQLQAALDRADPSIGPVFTEGPDGTGPQVNLAGLTGGQIYTVACIANPGTGTQETRS